MLQGTGHPAEKPEFTPASQLDPGPSRFLVVKSACGSLCGMIRPSNLHEIYKQKYCKFL